MIDKIRRKHDIKCDKRNIGNFSVESVAHIIIDDEIWASAPIEAADRPQHNGIFTAIIRELGGSFSFRSDAPDVVEFVMFRVPEKRRLLVGMINLQERFRPIEIHEFDIFVRMDSKPERVFIIPDEKEIKYSYADHEAVIHIDRLATFEMIGIDY